MSASALSGAFAVACVLLLTASGGFYVLMAVAVQRSGTPIQLLSVSFDPRKRLAIAAQVLREYKRLCEERGRSPLLHLLLWVLALLAIGCAANGGRRRQTTKTLRHEERQGRGERQTARPNHRDMETQRTAGEGNGGIRATGWRIAADRGGEC